MRTMNDASKLSNEDLIETITILETAAASLEHILAFWTPKDPHRGARVFIEAAVQTDIEIIRKQISKLTGDSA